LICFCFDEIFFQVINQLVIDYDYIEVTKNRYLKLSSRTFVPCPFVEEDFGRISPRCFRHLKSISGCDGGYFSASIYNSFPDLFERVQFVNKMYQCFLCLQLPHKVRKLVVYGPCDSGKSSWANVFFGLMPKNKIAVLTKEKNFGSSMIMEDTELLYVDEWCKEMLSPDSIKTLFQGGFFAQSVKHETPRMQTMTSGVFMTCNELPNFGDEQANVMRRLSVFETKALTDHHPEAPNWIKENAMECLVWMMTFINSNIELVLPEERFYERDRGEDAKARLNTFPKNVAKEIQTTSLMEVEFQEHQDDIDCTTELHKEILKGKIFSNIVNVNK